MLRVLHRVFRLEPFLPISRGHPWHHHHHHHHNHYHHPLPPLSRCVLSCSTDLSSSSSTVVVIFLPFFFLILCLFPSSSRLRREQPATRRRRRRRDCHYVNFRTAILTASSGIVARQSTREERVRKRHTHTHTSVLFDGFLAAGSKPTPVRLLRYRAAHIQICDDKSPALFPREKKKIAPRYANALY